MSETRYRQSRRLAAREIDGKGVVIVIDKQELHTLNGVGMRVFELAQGATAAQIAAKLAEEYEVEEAQALSDAEGFLQELVRLGALEIEA